VTSAAEVGELLRSLAPQALGAVIRRFGDFDAAEDGVQEALLAASVHWPEDGLPDNPVGWLVRTANRSMTDQFRSDVARRRREERVAREDPSAPQVIDKDDTLKLLFMCCHPALTPPSAIALTLRAVGGLTTAEIAAAYLVPEATMAQRISRAKQRIKASGLPFEIPGGADQPQRLRAVLHVLYLIFNEGYTTTEGVELARPDLTAEAIRLTRGLRTLLPDDGEVSGLLALMLLTDARRPARTTSDGSLVPLDKQDRTLWDQALITEGTVLVADAMSHGSISEYQVQAAIAAVHDHAAQASDTDWAQIVTLYGLLERMTGNPIVTLNRAIAEAMAHGPAVGLTLLEALDVPLAGHYRLDAVRGHLYDMLGDTEAAARHYTAAAARTTSLPERQYLIAQAARLKHRHD
jgi:RNA polymerase sigma factor (sigma-70 family)